jgi:signal transduction histidine kinase
MVSPTTTNEMGSHARTTTTTQPAVTGQPQRGWLLAALIAGYVVAFGLAARLLLVAGETGYLAWYMVLLVLFFVLYTLVWVRPNMGGVFLHTILIVQCVVVVVLLFLEPDFDYVTGFFVVLGYQAAVVFGGRARWLWVGATVLLIAGSLIAAWGLLRGLGFALTTMAFAVVFPGLAVASQEIEAARAESRTMVGELEETHQRLKKYAAEVEVLAALEERNRLARELHDSVSQAMFGIQLATRSAQIMRKKDPEAVRAQVERLQVLTQDALARMRGFISELRPKS